MRISTISSSFATVVSRVIESVVVAGTDRNCLHLGMCERDASTGTGYRPTQTYPAARLHGLAAHASQGFKPQLLWQVCIKRLPMFSSPKLVPATVRSHG